MEKENKYLYKTDLGLILCVKLVPNSSFNKIVDFTEEYIRIKISSPPIENKANKELISFCSDILKVNKSKLKIISGEKSKLKKVLITDSDYDDILKKLMFMLDLIQK